MLRCVFPHLPTLSCSEWGAFQWLPFVLVIILGVLIVVATVAAVLRLLGCTWKENDDWRQFILEFLTERPFLYFLLGALVIVGVLESVLLAALISGHAMLPQWLRWHVDIPLPATCAIAWVDPPVLFPAHAGATLPRSEQAARPKYFLSLLVELVMLAACAGRLVTYLGRVYRNCPRGVVYTQIGSAPQISLCEHLTLHFTCGGLAFVAYLMGWLEAKVGMCWEVWVLWAICMLAATLSHAIYFAIILPLGSEVPDFAWPVIQGVIPVLGEPLDTFKDWVFIAIAVEKRTPLSVACGLAGMVILLLSNLHMRETHLEELGLALMPVRAALLQARTLDCQGRLAQQVSPAKLWIALTEDLPQAVLQSSFALAFGGSATQHVSIAISVLKIFSCLFLGALALEREGRHGDAWEMSVEYHKLELWFFSIFEPGGARHLDAQNKLIRALRQLDRHEDAFEVCRECFEVRRELLGTQNEETLWAQYSLAVSLRELGQLQDAYKVFRQVVPPRERILGVRDPRALFMRAQMAHTQVQLSPSEEALWELQGILEVQREVKGLMERDTLLTESYVARALHALGSYEDALRREEEVGHLRLKAFGPNDPDTLKSRHNCAVTLRASGKLREALATFQEVLADRRRVLRPRHRQTLETQRQVHELCLELNEDEDGFTC